MQKSVLVLLGVLGSAFGNDCQNLNNCNKCLKKDGCAWFVDPLAKVANCITDNDCDVLQPGSPASCTKTRYLASYLDFQGLSKAKMAKQTCKIFSKKLRKNAAPPPTQPPNRYGLDCSAYPFPFDCVLQKRGRVEFVEYCGGCACAPELECNPGDYIAPTAAPIASPELSCGRFWKAPYDCTLVQDDDDFEQYCGRCDCIPTDTECTEDKIRRIEIGSSDDDIPPTYFLAYDDEAFDDLNCENNDPCLSCVAQTCDLDGLNCGAPFCGEELCLNAIEEPDDKNCQIRTIEITSRFSDDFLPPTYLLAYDDEAFYNLDCGSNNDPCVGCVAETCAPDRLNCGEPFCGERLCLNAIKEPDDNNCQIRTIEIGGRRDDDVPPTYLVAYDDEAFDDLDCGNNDPCLGCVAETCDLDSLICGEPFCGERLCLNAIKQPDDNNCQSLIDIVVDDD